MQIAGIIIAVFVALFFFGLRARHQFWYGLIEIIAAVAGMYFVFFPLQTSYLRSVSPGPSMPEIVMAKSVGLLAAIYIFVRGMDNMDKNLPVSWRRRWDRIFRGKGE